MRQIQNYAQDKKNSWLRVLSINSCGALDALGFEHLLAWIDPIARAWVVLHNPWNVMVTSRSRTSCSTFDP